MSWKYLVTTSNDWGYTVSSSNTWKYTVSEGSSVWMDNIFQLNIDGTPDFDGQWGFDSDIDLVSETQSVKNDLYVGLDGSWHLLKEMTFTSTDFTVRSPPDLTRAVESDDNMGLAWTAQRTTGYMDRIISKQLKTYYDATRIKITARAATELALSDYATLQEALTALNSAGAGSQLNIDEDITMGAGDTTPEITIDDCVIYSDNQSVITIGADHETSHPFRFTGDNVHIMGISINLNVNVTSASHHGIVHTDCTGFSVIGCDVRNSGGYNYTCIRSTNGVYGACVGTVSGDDVFALVTTSDNVVAEFCVGGCSQNTFGTSRSFETEDGSNAITFYKNIAFGQLSWGGFECHIHAGEDYVSNLLWEECLSLYNSWGYSMDGDNMTTGNVRDSVITNCRDIQSFYRWGDMNQTVDCSITNNWFDWGYELYGVFGSDSKIYWDGESTGTIVTGNISGGSSFTNATGATISNNDFYSPSGTAIGVSLGGGSGNTVENNTINNNIGYASLVEMIRVDNSDSNALNNNTIADAIKTGIRFMGTSDGNTGTGNDLDLATTEVLDESSGTNTIT